MPEVNKPQHQDGDFLVDYEEKVFEDVQAEPGAKALVTFHTIAFEGDGVESHQCFGSGFGLDILKNLFLIINEEIAVLMLGLVDFGHDRIP